MITATERFSVSPKEDGAGLFAKSSYDVLAIQKFGPESGTYFLIADENKNFSWVSSTKMSFNRIEVVMVEVLP